MRKFGQSPLPFQGQKRKFTREFAIALDKYPSNGVYIDLFGGSGLLSHTVKSVYPGARVFITTLMVLKGVWMIYRRRIGCWGNYG